MKISAKLAFISHLEADLPAMVFGILGVSAGDVDGVLKKATNALNPMLVKALNTATLQLGALGIRIKVLNSRTELKLDTDTPD